MSNCLFSNDWTRHTLKKCNVWENFFYVLTSQKLNFNFCICVELSKVYMVAAGLQLVCYHVNFSLKGSGSEKLARRSLPYLLLGSRTVQNSLGFEPRIALSCCLLSCLLWCVNCCLFLASVIDTWVPFFFDTWLCWVLSRFSYGFFFEQILRWDKHNINILFILPVWFLSTNRIIRLSVLQFLLRFFSLDLLGHFFSRLLSSIHWSIAV